MLIINSSLTDDGFQQILIQFQTEDKRVDIYS